MVTQNPDVAKRLWWSVLLRGIIAIIFGIIALAWPGLTVLVIVIIFGIYAIIDGIVAVIRGISGRGSDSSWGWWIALGVLSVIVGIVAIVWPDITAVVLLYIIAFYAIFFGIIGAAGSFQLKGIPGTGWGWLLVASIIAIAFGVTLLIASPEAGIVAITWLIAWYAIIFGVLLVIAAFEIRSYVNKLTA